MNKLQTCYTQLRRMTGHNIEPYDSVALVEKYRQYWRPEKIKIILLAESHVFTSDDDRKIELPQITELAGYPTQYAKFVYCLAYGERQLTKNKLHPPKDGTPQFWKIFYSCNNRIEGNEDFMPVLSKTNYERRIKNKIELLLSLRQNGVWLVDSSIVALYHNGKKPANNIISSVIRQSWEGYTRGVIEEAAPEHIICIGKTVASIVVGDIRHIVGKRHTIIDQPNARLKSAAHIANFKKYGEICCKD